MCLLIYSQKRRIPKDHLQNGLDSNRDGWGIWAGGHVWKGLKEKEFWATWDEIPYALPVVVHFRFGTHGGVSLDNCHPAPLMNGGLLFHNGVISQIDTRGGESDTRAFGRLIGSLDLSEKNTLRLIKYAVGSGNKLVIVHNGADPLSRVSIINEKAGIWRKGIWYSNSGFESSKFSYLSKMMGEGSTAAGAVADTCAVGGKKEQGGKKWKNKTWPDKTWRPPSSDTVWVPVKGGGWISKRADELTTEEGKGQIILPGRRSEPRHQHAHGSFPRVADHGVPAPARRDPLEHGWSLGGSEDRALEKAIGEDLGRRGFDRSADSPWED